MKLLLIASIILLFLVNAHAEFIDFRERWAILIGVGKYSDADILPLFSPEHDVNEMKEVLIKRGGFLDDDNHITTLIDEQATYKGIEEAFDKLSNKVMRQHDFVLFYFSGRGARIADDLYPDFEEDGLDECLLLYDAVKGETKNKFLRDDELVQLLNSLNAKGIAIIVDSCYSGTDKREKGIPELDKGNDKPRDGITASDYLSTDITTIILEACAPDEVTLDGATKQSKSLFTEKLIKSLENDDVDSNRDGVIAFDELHLHLKKALSQQTPNLVGKVVEKTPIILPYVPITSEPSNAQIFVDGKDKKITTPNNIILLDLQEHQLKLKKAGYHDWLSKLKAFNKPGEQKEIKAQLNPIVVTGRLVDKSKKLIEGARVTLRLKAEELTIGETTTGSDGYFSFSDWQKNPSVVGDYEISFHFKGYEQSSEIKIEKSDDVDIGTIEFLKATESHTVLWLLSIAAAILIIVVPTVYILRMRAMTTEKYRSEHYPIWERQIENSLLTEGKALLSSFIDEEHQAYASNRYIKQHSDFDLFYDEKENSLRVKSPSQIEEFNDCWKNAASNLDADSGEQIKSLQESSTKIIHLLCDAMGFTVDHDSPTSFDMLWGCMVDATVLRTKIPSKFPFICIQRRTITDEDIRSLRDIMISDFRIANRFALIIVFDNADRTRQLVSAFHSSFDFIILDKDSSLDILMAKNSREILMRSILEQMDLTVISPYVIAGPVPEEMFFGRDNEIKTVVRTLERNSIAVVGGRRVGKTSILQKVYRDFSQPQGDWYPIHADFQPINNYEKFFKYINTTWGLGIRGKIYSPEQFYDLISNLRKNHGCPIAILMDEVDDLLRDDVEHGEALFKTFRALSQEGEKCQFVFSGERVLNERIRSRDSPLFNFCKIIPLSYLDKQSAELLIREPMARINVEIEDQVVEEILKISSCHPRIIQYICNRIISVISEEQTRRVTLKHFQNAAGLDIREEFMGTILGRCTPLEQLISLLMIDKKNGFSRTDIRNALNNAKVEVSEINLTNAINNLLLNAVLQLDKEGYSFTAKEFPRVVKMEKDIPEIKELKEEIEEN